MDTLTKVSDKISQILWGKSFVDVYNCQDISNTFVLRSLSIRENNYLNFIYDKELSNAMQEGILTQDQLRRLFYAQGVWTDSEETKKETLKKELDIVSKQLKNSEFQTVRKKNLKKKLEKINLELAEINKHEVALFSVSAENRAEEVRRRLMVFLFAENVNEEPYWSCEQDFMQSSDGPLLNNLINAYFINNIYSEKQLRAIARHGEWRFRWTAAKHGEQLFGKSIANWSEMQNMLVYWSQYYDSIYESMDRPADFIIQDDVMCDLWVSDQNKKANKNMAKSNKKTGQKMDHAEQFVMVAKDDKEAIEKLQDMNPSDVRSQIRKEFEQIKGSDGRVKEWQLGGRKDTTLTKIKRKGR